MGESGFRGEENFPETFPQPGFRLWWGEKRDQRGSPMMGRSRGVLVKFEKERVDSVGQKHGFDSKLLE